MLPTHKTLRGSSKTKIGIRNPATHQRPAKILVRRIPRKPSVPFRTAGAGTLPWGGMLMRQKKKKKEGEIKTILPNTCSTLILHFHLRESSATWPIYYGLAQERTFLVGRFNSGGRVAASQPEGCGFESLFR